MQKIAICALLAVVITFPSGLAWHGATEPIVDSVSLDDLHWVAWRIALASPGKVVVELDATVADVEIVALGASLMGPDGSDPDTGYWVLQAATTHTFVQAFGEAPRIDSRSGFVNGEFKVAFTWNSVPAGEHILLGMVPGVGSVTAGEITLRASGNATLLAKTEGSNAFGALPRHFSGDANVRWGNPTVMATVIVNASHERTIEDKLFAFWWRHPHTSANPLHPVLCDIRYDGPDGGGAERQYYFINGAPAGSYTFRVPHCADVGAGPFRTQLFLLGADVRLPV